MTYEPRPWTDYDDRVLRHLYAHQPNEVIGEHLGRSRKAIGLRARKLGLKKPPHLIERFQFKPGLTPWNKGTHYRAGGRSAETRFKKGQMRGAAQHNYRPVGSHRISKDQYLERKVTDDPTIYPARRWKAVHRLVWESEHGPVPAGRWLGDEFRRYFGATPQRITEAA